MPGVEQVRPLRGTGAEDLPARYYQAIAPSFPNEDALLKAMNSEERNNIWALQKGNGTVVGRP